MRHRVRRLGGAAAIAVAAVVVLVVLPTRQAGAGSSGVESSGILPTSVAGIPLPSLPPLPLPTISPPDLPLPTLKPPTTAPGTTTRPPTTQAPAPAAPNAGTAGAPTAPGGPGPTVTADGVGGAIGGDPGADLYPQPPVDPATTPQAKLVAQLNDAEHRVQYLRNVLARSHTELAAAQARLGVVPQLITYLAAPNPPSPGLRTSAAAPVLTLAAAIDADEAELARRETEVTTLQQQVNQGVTQILTAGATTSGAGAAPANGKLRRPVPGAITSRFGNRFDPFYHVWQLHAGVDIGAPAGTSIVAAAGGKVTQAGWNGGYGNYTCIDHGQVNGQRLSTCYGHQQAILVTPGQQVSAGQVIGQVGSTGASTGPHLHFEVRLGGRPVDPLPWL